MALKQITIINCDLDNVHSVAMRCSLHATGIGERATKEVLNKNISLSSSNTFRRIFFVFQSHWFAMSNSKILEFKGLYSYYHLRSYELVKWEKADKSKFEIQK